MKANEAFVIYESQKMRLGYRALWPGNVVEAGCTGRNQHSENNGGLHTEEDLQSTQSRDSEINGAPKARTTNVKCGLDKECLE